MGTYGYYLLSLCQKVYFFDTYSNGLVELDQVSILIMGLFFLIDLLTNEKKKLCSHYLNSRCKHGCLKMSLFL